MKTTSERRPRFTRAEALPGLVPQERDDQILEHVARHRLLRSTHIANLVGGSRKTLLNRLHLLYHHGYLERPRAQIDYYRGGSRPMVYALGAQGARRLGHERPPKHVRDRLFLDHTLGVADFMIALGLACRRDGNLRLIESGEILAGSPARIAQRKRPFRLTVDVPFRGSVAPVSSEPDAAFGLDFSERQAARAAFFFFLEHDRGTESVIPTTLARTSPLRKMLVYREAWRQWKNGARRPDFGFVDYRVLFVTTSPARIETMLAANRVVVRGGSRLFLFATASDACHTVEGLHAAQQGWGKWKAERRRAGMSAADPKWTEALREYEKATADLEISLLHAAWTNGRGERVQLID